MAPRSLVRTAEKYQARVRVEMLPPVDDDKNARPWHAKMLTLRSEAYSALTATKTKAAPSIGSSNFTCAGMGVTPHRHAEANLLTLVDRVASGRESGRLEAIRRAKGPPASSWSTFAYSNSVSISSSPILACSRRWSSSRDGDRPG